jgi:hypothetical protein
MVLILNISRVGEEFRPIDTRKNPDPTDPRMPLEDYLKKMEKTGVIPQKTVDDTLAAQNENPKALPDKETSNKDTDKE